MTLTTDVLNLLNDPWTILVCSRSGFHLSEVAVIVMKWKSDLPSLFVVQGLTGMFHSKGNLHFCFCAAMACSQKWYAWEQTRPACLKMLVAMHPQNAAKMIALNVRGPVSAMQYLMDLYQCGIVIGSERHEKRVHWIVENV